MPERQPEGRRYLARVGMMQPKLYIGLVPAPGQYLDSCVQSRSGTCLMQKTHVLGFDEQLSSCRAVKYIHELQSAREPCQCLLDSRHVIATIEVPYVIAFPCIGAAPPDLDRCSGHATTKSA